MFAFIVTTSCSITSLFYGVEDDPPPDSHPCLMRGLDLPHFTPGYIQMMCMPTTKTIIFEGGVITEVPHIFKDYPNVTTVSAERCNVEEIYGDSFKGADHLRFLLLSNNNIKILRNHSFSPATELYKLEIRNSNLKTLEPNAFDNLAKLVHLELNDNLIKVLPLGIFDPLTALGTLVLSNNAIMRLDESKLFMHNRFLSYVYLDANDIVEIHEETFVKNSVRWLNLAENPGLVSLHLSWELLVNLTMLKVCNTGLQQIIIPPNADTVLANNNEIDSVVESFSKGNSRKGNPLTRLSLARNKMRNMDSLAAFPQLEMLDLSDNELESLEVGQLPLMPNLKQFAVGRNPIYGSVNVKALKRRFPMLNTLVMSQGKWTEDYYNALDVELSKHNVTLIFDVNFWPHPVPLPTTPASGSFDPKKFELLIKELHDNYTVFEKKMKMIRIENHRQSQILSNAVYRNTIIYENIQYMENWLYLLISFTTVAFIIMCSVHCGLSDLRRWILDCLPARIPIQPLTEHDLQPSPSRRSSQHSLVQQNN